jgi:hypothetical protein
VKRQSLTPVVSAGVFSCASGMTRNDITDMSWSAQSNLSYDDIQDGELLESLPVMNLRTMTGGE